MTSWIATSSKPGETPDEPTVIDGRSSPKLKAQVEAAGKLAKTLAESHDGDVLVNMSGYAGTKDDTTPDSVQVTVARAE